MASFMRRERQEASSTPRCEPETPFCPIGACNSPPVRKDLAVTAPQKSEQSAILWPKRDVAADDGDQRLNLSLRVGQVEITRVLEFEAALFEPAVIHPEASSEIIAHHRACLEPAVIDPVSAYELRLPPHPHQDAASDHPARYLLGQ